VRARGRIKRAYFRLQVTWLSILPTAGDVVAHAWCMRAQEREASVYAQAHARALHKVIKSFIIF
jgi:hypothetical protein